MSKDVFFYEIFGNAFHNTLESTVCTVTLIDDFENQVVEGDEEFTVYLTNEVGATLGQRKETKIIISDVEEDSPKFEFGETQVRAAESVGVVSVPVKRLGKNITYKAINC